MKNKTLRIILDLVLIIVGIVFLIFGIKDAYNFYKENKIEDSVRFKKSYRSAPEDNIYKYVSLKEANEILLEKSGIILLGRTDDPWMQVLVSPLNDIVSESIDEIYYVEMDDIDHPDFELELEEVTLPYIVIVKEGKVLTELDKSDIIDAEYEEAPIEYFDEANTRILKEKLSKITELHK